MKKHFKHFIGYKKNKKVRPLSIILPKMVAYRSDFDETEYMPFLIKDDKLLEKYDKISVKSAIESEKNSIVNLYTIENT